MHHMNMEDTEYVSVFLANIYLFKAAIVFLEKGVQI